MQSRRVPHLALCLFGVAGVQAAGQKAALQVDLSAEAVFGAADSQLRHVVEPIENAGWRVAIFAHSWAGARPRIAAAVDAAYGERLAGSTHERFGLYTSESVHSMLLSITTSLRLARHHAARTPVWL